MSSQGEGQANPGAADQRGHRYFVTVYLPGRAQVGRVMRFGLDLFEESVREEQAGRVAVDGLLTLAEAGRLVDDGANRVCREFVVALKRRLVLARSPCRRISSATRRRVALRPRAFNSRWTRGLP